MGEGMQNYPRRGNAGVPFTFASETARRKNPFLLNPVICVGAATIGLWALILSAIAFVWS